MPGPIAATVTPASARASALEGVEEQADAVGAGEADEGDSEPIAGRSTGSGSIRIDGVSTTSAPSAASRAASPLACARARVTATTLPCSGPLLDPGQGLAQAGGGADHGDRRRAQARVLHRGGDVGERAAHRPLAGQGAALDHGRGLVGRPPRRDQPLGDPRQVLHAHVEHQRARERARGPPSPARSPPSIGSSCPVTNATAEARSRWVTGMPA